MVEQVFALYREKYFDFSVRHFHEKLWEDHGIAIDGPLMPITLVIPFPLGRGTA